jgi:hypothetical protein
MPNQRQKFAHDSECLEIINIINQMQFNNNLTVLKEKKDDFYNSFLDLT